MILSDMLNTMITFGYFDCIHDKNELAVTCKKLDRIEESGVDKAKLEEFFKSIINHNNRMLLKKTMEFVEYILKISKDSIEEIDKCLYEILRLMAANTKCWDNDYYMLAKIFNETDYYIGQHMNLDYIRLCINECKIYRIFDRGDLIINDKYKRVKVVNDNGFNYLHFENESRLVGFIILVDGIAGSYDSEEIKSGLDVYKLVNEIGIDNIDLIITAHNHDNLEQLIKMRLN